jgi:hypothetical protein
MSVASYEGGGCHGHLGIIMKNEENFAIAVDVFHVPNNPEPLAAVVATTPRCDTSVPHIPQRISGY